MAEVTGAEVTGADVIGTAPDGSVIEAVTLTSGDLTARVMSYGATLMSLRLAGVAHSLILGSPDPRAYAVQMKYYGAVVGPVANRIAGAGFSLGGRHFATDANERGLTTLHGGAQGMGERVWRFMQVSRDVCTLALRWEDGWMGFPGPIDIAMTYRLEDSTLAIEVTGTAGAEVLFAPAFHGYWNLSGAADIFGHQLTVDAPRYTPVGGDLIPEGVAPVEGTAFDYRAGRAPDRGLDHNFITRNGRGGLRHMARLEGGNLALDVASTEPGLQVYGGLLCASGAFEGNDGPFGAHAGIALEPQLWPDAANRPDFPSPRLGPGESYTQYARFSLTRLDEKV